MAILLILLLGVILYWVKCRMDKGLPAGKKSDGSPIMELIVLLLEAVA